MPERETQAEPKSEGLRSEEARRMCGTTIALILALDGRAGGEAPDAGQRVSGPLRLHGEEPVVCWSMRTAIRAQVDMVYVLAAPSVSHEITRLADMMHRRKSDPFVQVLEVDLQALEQRTASAGGFELLGVPFGVLELARAFLETGIVEHDAALIMNADDAGAKAEDLYRLREVLKRDKEANAVAAGAGEDALPAVFSDEILRYVDDALIGDETAQANAAAELVARSLA